MSWHVSDHDQEKEKKKVKSAAVVLLIIRQDMFLEYIYFIQKKHYIISQRIYSYNNMELHGGNRLPQPYTQQLSRHQLLDI